MRSILLTSCATALLVSPAPAVASTHGWAKASSISRTIVVGAALAVPGLQADWHGLGGAALALGVTGAATYGLKQLVHETRPDGSDDQSFPSGHTSLSFAAAASLHKRYGWKAGLPAYAVASFTGFARVKADKHYTHDVLAGAVIGTGAGWLLNNRHDTKVEWLPWTGHHGGGVSLSYRF